MKILLRLFLVFFLAFSGFIFSQKKWNVRYYHEIVGSNVLVYTDNTEVMPMSVKLTFELENMESDTKSGEIIVIPPQSEKIEIAKFSVVKPNTANKFSYQTQTIFGDVVNAKPDEDFVYELPFEEGKTYMVFQGYNGKLSHKNINALDFNLKTGEKIYVARAGLVVDVVAHHTKNCNHISCAKYNNYILILHSDGTFADYSHLKNKGAEVKIGDEVSSGDFIGYSGNTGYSTGAHLHFSVFKNKIDGSREYVKTKFRISKDNATFLEEKKTYTKYFFD